MSVSSNLQTQPSWLDTFPSAAVSYGFDSTGMWFSGDISAVNSPYPIRTNYDIDSDTTVEVIYTFIHAAVDENCPDQSICFFKSDVEPYWEWGTNVSRIAVVYDCGNPSIAGQADNEVGAQYSLTIGNTYTARVTYNPTAQTTTHELFEGTSAAGSPVNTIVLENERLPAGSYRIGFAADLDTSTNEKSYFTYLEISEGPEALITRVFRAIHLPHRRREAENAVDGAPLNVQPGELLYDYEQNKLYAGQNDRSVIEVGGGSGNSNPFDQDLNTTDSVTFNSVALPNGTQITVGSFDNNTSGVGGISLWCAVGVELNWQGGHLKATADGGQTAANILCDSPLEFPGAGIANMQLDAVGLTFPDGTQQTTAGAPLKSDATGITGAAALTNIVKISQAAYDALVNKDETTLYIIDG